MSNAINFPGIGISFDIPEVAFSIFGLGIRWYGIIIALGFMLAFIYGMKRCEQFGFSQDDLMDMLLVATPAGIIGARAYYVIFNYDIFRGNPTKIFQLWTGGLAIYGGIIGALLAAAIVAKVKKIKIMSVFDIGALGFLIGQAVGRWGNFINREAYGTVTNLPWRMEIWDWSRAQRIAVHPTFLYESLWNVLGFVLLHFASKRRKYDGQTFWTYVAWYGVGRGLIEGLRTDSLYLFGTDIRVSQLLAFGSCLAALLILGYNAFFKVHDPEDMQVRRYKAKLALANGNADLSDTSTTVDANTSAEVVDVAADAKDADVADDSVGEEDANNTEDAKDAEDAEDANDTEDSEVN